MLPSPEVELRLSRGLTHEPPDYWTPQSWKGYRSLFAPNAHPRLEEAVTPEADIVVHPGWWNYTPDHKKGDEHMAFTHESYMFSLQQKVREAAEAKRSIIVFTPVDHRTDTLRAIGLPTYDKLILVPNYRKTTETGATDLHLYLLKIEDEKVFWSRLASVVRQVALYEEYGNGYVSAVETKLLTHNISVSNKSNVIFDYPQELIEK